MAKKSVELLLTENVDNLGIVGDVVKVRLGYARNYLLPRGLATEPSEELLKELAGKRAEAERELAELRKMRENTIDRLSAVELSLDHSCNDQGVLYAAVTQSEIAAALTNAGYPVRARDVRLSTSIKRVGDYEVHIRFDSDLETRIKLHVKPDREIQSDEREEMEFDDEGNLVTQERREARERRAAAKAAAKAAERAQAAAATKG